MIAYFEADGCSDFFLDEDCCVVQEIIGSGYMKFRIKLYLAVLTVSAV